MPVLRIVQPLVDVVAKRPEEDNEASEYASPMTECGRCRLTFTRHPSILHGDSTEWALCPRCQRLSLSARSERNASWK